MNTPDLNEVPTEIILKMLSARDSVHVCRVAAEALLQQEQDEDSRFLSTVGVQS